jgi:hypothetical protein
MGWYDPKNRHVSPISEKKIIDFDKDYIEFGDCFG